MFKIPLSDLKEKIICSGKVTAEQLERSIKNKINELSGLISEEGASHIIANELGIEVFSQQQKLKIKELYSGMRNISTAGKVVRKFDIRTFQKGESLGKVCSFILGDETGTIRVVLWNDQVEQLSTVNENDIVLIKEAYVRENRDNKEIHLGDRGSLQGNPQGEVIETVRKEMSYIQKSIQELQGEENAEIMGTVVQVFDPRFFYLCSECRKRAQQNEGAFTCAEHGTIKPELSYVINVVIDDGTGTIRSIFWKNQTHHLLRKDEASIAQYKDHMNLFECVKTDLLGEQFKLKGRVQKNDMFQRLELNVQIVENANPQEELARLEKVQ